MVVKWLLAVLILIIFISGCVGQDGDGVKPEYSDNALKMEYEVTEKVEKRRILPGQTIRMVVYLTNQVENDTSNVTFKVSDPYGIKITKIHCGIGCECNIDDETPKDCADKNWCIFNGCHYDKIQSLDQEEIDLSLKIPIEKEVAKVGHELKPELTVEYDYSGESAIYIPIIQYGEKIEKPKPDSTQTIGPIKATIETDNWVFNDSIFPVYITVKDVVGSEAKLEIKKEKVRLFLNHILTSKDLPEEDMGRCDFNKVDNSFEICQHYSCYQPEEDLEIPTEPPLICSLKSSIPDVPMLRGVIGLDYSYRYVVKERETIKVEKGLV